MEKGLLERLFRFVTLVCLILAAVALWLLKGSCDDVAQRCSKLEAWHVGKAPGTFGGFVQHVQKHLDTLRENHVESADAFRKMRSQLDVMSKGIEGFKGEALKDKARLDGIARAMTQLEKTLKEIERRLGK